MRRLLAAASNVLDVRPGEGRAVVLTFLYVALAVAGFLLAKPIRNGLFLAEYGAYSLVYAYVAVPLVLAVGLPIYGLISERVGTRAVITGSLVFFGLNVLLFWWAFRFHGQQPGRRLLRLGELLRGRRAGAGLDVRQLGVRRPAGQAAVRPDRRRGQRRGHRRRPARPRAGAADRHGQPAAGPGRPDLPRGGRGQPRLVRAEGVAAAQETPRRRCGCRPRSASSAARATSPPWR